MNSFQLVGDPSMWEYSHHPSLQNGSEAQSDTETIMWVPGGSLPVTWDGLGVGSRIPSVQFWGLFSIMRDFLFHQPGREGHTQSLVW